MIDNNTSSNKRMPQGAMEEWTWEGGHFLSSEILESIPEVLENAENFLQNLEWPFSAHTFQTFDDTGEERPELVKIFHGHLYDVIAELYEFNRRGAGVFVTAQRTNFLGAKIDNILSIRTVFAYFDNGLPDGFPLCPHMIVETSPGKFYCYWNCDFVSAHNCLQIMERLVLDYGANRKAVDLAGALRLPGFYHGKNVDFQIKMCGGGGDGPYRPSELLEAFPPIPTTEG